MKKIVAVIGSEVSKYSLSPKIHNFWINKYNLNASYIPIDIKEEDFEEVISSIFKIKNFIGANITIPFKERACNVFSAQESEIKAINTISKIGAEFYSYNTDIYGFRKSIEDNLSLKRRVLLLGAGGAAKAIIKALEELGFSEIYVANRTLSKAMELGKNWIKWEEKEQLLTDIDLLVNATSLGLSGNNELQLNFAAANKNMLVTDIIYNPLKTKLLIDAEKEGIMTIDGLWMLLYQAAKAFEIWFDIQPEVNFELRNYVLAQ